MNHRRATHHPSYDSARRNRGLAPNAPEARNSVAANSAALETSAATNNRDSHSHSNCRPADFPGTPNSSGAASTSVDCSKRSSADSPNSRDYRCADWMPLAADRSASGSNQIQPALDLDRCYFSVLPSCDCCLRLAVETTPHCPAHFLRRTDGWRLQRLRFRPHARSSDSARRYPLARYWPKNDSARKRAA